jgi:hypothetical protein
MANYPVRTCPEWSVSEPYRSPDWALVPAKTGPRAEYLSNHTQIYKPLVRNMIASHVSLALKPQPQCSFHLLQCCHLAAACCSIWPMLNCFSSLSKHLTENTTHGNDCHGNWSVTHRLSHSLNQSSNHSITCSLTCKVHTHTVSFTHQTTHYHCHQQLFVSVWSNNTNFVRHPIKLSTHSVTLIKLSTHSVTLIILSTHSVTLIKLSKHYAHK